MIDLNILKRVLIVGIVLQLALVGCAHFLPWLRPNLLFACMLIAGVTGLLYARDLARGYGVGALGGAVGGATSALAAVGAANVLGDQPEIYLPYAVMVAMLTGAVGGMFGEFGAWLNARIRSL
jgi:hypothetical protein